MNNNEIQNIVVSCNKKFNRWTAVALIISFLILFIGINVVLKILIAVAFFFTVVTIASAVIKNKYISPILNDELNPQKYYAVICGTHNATKYAIDEMVVAYFMHDYNAVINICNLKINDKKTGNYKYLFIQYLARTYFDLGDYENLKLTCEIFENELSKIKNLKSAQRLRSIFENPIKYYKNYLSGDFKACKEQYKRLIDEGVIIKSKLQKISAYYLYAIACYKIGEFDEAKSYFAMIENEAPLLGYCETAKKYIYAINNNEEFVCDKQNIEIEQNYEIPRGKTAKTDKKRVTIGIIAIIILTAIICVASVKNTPSTPEKILKNTQSMTELIVTAKVEKEDLLCFYNTKYNGYSAAFLEFIDENKYRVDTSIVGIYVGYIYEIGITEIDKVIEFSLYDNFNDVPENIFMVKEISIDADTMYFCITDVRDEKMKFSYTSSRLIDDEYYW